jgi:hypothetical protein
MDILAHALWTNYSTKTANRKLKKNKKKIYVKPLEAAAWGVFPDFFAFGITMGISIFKIIENYMNNGAPLSLGGRMGFMDPTSLNLSHALYDYSHSLVIFLVVFIAVWAIRRKPHYALLGWALHILIDIPSHAGNFFLTPFLFPLSDYQFTHGVSWANPYFMIINYSLLAIASVYFYITRKKDKEIREAHKQLQEKH